MAPVRNYSNWNQRFSDQQEQVEPYQKFFFICEGANTEVFYFKRLIDLRKQLGIHPLIDLCLLEKTEEDRTISYPLKLIEFAELQKQEQAFHFDPDRDKMIVVFDADIFEKNSPNYGQVLAKAQEYKDIVAVTNPAFELFLLLHYEGSFESDIVPNAENILQNGKENNKTFIYRLLFQHTKMNSKTNPRIGDLAMNVDVAIEQEQKLNQDIDQCHGKLTCNIGKIISDIRSIKAPSQ